jgi:hypothetical protein
MSEHPQYAMWKAQYEAEQALARDRAAWHARREEDDQGLREAWRNYQIHWHAGLTRRSPPRWWHLRAWLRLLGNRP